jgi:small subunit ribosomal protein S8
MTIMDPIADMFTRIRNGLQARLDTVVIPTSKNKVRIAEILQSEGFIDSFSVEADGAVKKILRIKLRYTHAGIPTISTLLKISKSTKRTYVKKSNVPKPLNGFGLSLISTSKGILSGKSARLNNVGGELIGIIY